VLVDEVSEDGALARSPAEAPQIDGVVRIANAAGRKRAGGRHNPALRAGEFAEVEIVAAEAYDLIGRLTDPGGEAAGSR
jgi:ribosomal protein S12 methylthiotransferase